jgi:nucleoside 2-deoxyribosyltransferase
VKVYLLGPMTGYPDKNREAFEEVACILRRYGHEVISPVEMEKESQELPWAEYLRLDLIHFLTADVGAGVALDGWEDSAGAALEVHVLRTLGKPIYRLAYVQDSYWDLVEVKEPSKYRPPTDENVLEEAMRLTVGDRDEDYGHPADDFSRTAGAWSSLFGWDVTPGQVALAMVVVKLSRLQKTPKKRDSVVDIAGYARTYEMTLERLDGR